MTDFINTVDAIGDDVLIDSIIERTVTEYKDDKVSKIGSNAFRQCSELTEVDIPTATGISDDAFNACTVLRSINAPLVTNIGSKAFADCKALEEADFPLVTSCGTSAGGGFVNCTNLERINFPLLQNMSNDFGGSALTRVMLPSVKKVLGLGNCKSLTFCDFPVAETVMGSAFFNSTALVTLILRNASVMCTRATTGSFKSTPIEKGTGYIYVPRAFLSDTDETKDYRRATNWSTFAAQFRALEDYTVDGTTTGELDETKI